VVVIALEFAFAVAAAPEIGPGFSLDITGHKKFGL
jgi:hypothetical protein